MTIARKTAAPKLENDVLELLRSYSDLVIFAEPLLLELWRSAGLTYAQIRALRWLRSNGCMSASELASKTNIPGPSLTRVLASLEEEGMVTRSIDQGDRRRIVIALTVRGRAAIGERNFYLLGNTVFAKAAQILSPALRAQLTKCLREFRAAIDRVDDGAFPDRIVKEMDEA